MSKLYFVSSNENKFSETSNILSNFGIDVEFFKTELQEIQSDSLSVIATKKVLDAFFRRLNTNHLHPGDPVIIEDDGLFLESQKGFPGPYSSYAFKTIGNTGILKLVDSQRAAKFVSIIAYCEENSDNPPNVELFESTVTGTISNEIRGDGWGYDPIFIPDGQTKTFAELSNKNKLSHRYASLKKFSSWFLNRQKYNDQ